VAGSSSARSHGKPSVTPHVVSVARQRGPAERPSKEESPRRDRRGICCPPSSRARTHMPRRQTVMKAQKATSQPIRRSFHARPPSPPPAESGENEDREPTRTQTRTSSVQHAPRYSSRLHAAAAKRQAVLKCRCGSRAGARNRMFQPVHQRQIPQRLPRAL
jgi:hypothetical protein